MSTTYLRNTFFIIICVFTLWACDRNSKDKSESTKDASKKHLTIYCENSMVPLLLDIKESFEKKHNCEIKLVNDCSQNLIGLINFSKEGDLFMPDSYAALQTLHKKSNITVTDSIFIGYNKLVLMVNNNNPLNFTGDLTQLSDSGIAIVLANPETSSLGHQTKQMLEHYNLYDDVVKNVVSLSVDSKGLVKSVANASADVAITWQSDMFENKNRDLIDSVLIAHEYSSEVYAGILSCTQNPTLAKYFIDFVSSDEGSNVIKKYGFTKRKSHIF